MSACAHAGQPLQHRLHLGRDVVLLAVVPVAVAGDEEHRLDLAETVEHALDAEIGRTGRPDRAERGGGEHAGDRLGHVGQHRGDAVALLRRRARASPAAAARPAPRSSSQDRRRSTLSSPRKTIASAGPDFRSRFSAKFSLASGKNDAPGILVAVDQHARSPRSPITPQNSQTRLQKPARSLDRPAVQVGIAGEAAAGASRRGRREGGQRAPRATACRRRRPELAGAVHAFSLRDAGHSYRVDGRRGYCVKIAGTFQKAPFAGHIGLK